MLLKGQIIYSYYLIEDRITAAVAGIFQHHHVMNGAAAERVKITVVRRASRICNQEEWQSVGSGATGLYAKLHSQ